MGSGIFLIQGDTQMVEMTEQAYATEDLLQNLLAKYPSLLAGNQMNPATPRKWLLISRETPLASEQGGSGRWSVDHLFLDQDAVPTIVEVKRSSDTRIRREVVGQILEYAANAVIYWPIQSLISQLETTCAAEGKEPSEVLANFLGEDEDTDTFWERVRTNLQAGRVRLVFVADYIGPELQRIVEFLNGQMNPAEVLAVQIKQYVGEGFKTLIPRVIGQTAQAQQTKAVGSKEYKREYNLWDEDSFFQVLKERSSPDDIKIARSILEWARELGLIIIWGKGKVNPGYRLRVDNDKPDHSLVGVWPRSLEILFGWLHAKPFDNESKHREWLHHLHAIPGVDKYVRDVTGNPNVPLAVFHNEKALQQLFEVLAWAVHEIRISHQSVHEGTDNSEQEV